MAIHIRVYVLPGTKETYSNPAGDFVRSLADAACRAQEPILHRRLSHIDPDWLDGRILGAAIGTKLFPPHHEACTMYVKISQDGVSDSSADVCFGYVPPPAVERYEKVAEPRRR